MPPPLPLVCLSIPLTSERNHPQYANDRIAARRVTVLSGLVDMGAALRGMLTPWEQNQLLALRKASSVTQARVEAKMALLRFKKAAVAKFIEPARKVTGSWL